ncbi:creatininase family protein [Ferrovibrio sp.]|uniref:creatininase family protein n=1 Tax=Ferrovibrio sp. TaxID=1917215 RepID=UPI00262855BB|nr:creatininase family protein [Ferrovibrio sp.]
MTPARRTGSRLADLTWIEAADLIGDGLPVLLPIGAAAKAHGPHLPLGTDRLVVEAVTERLLGELPLLAAPVIGHGFYPAFIDYPGSQHIEAATFQALVTELIEGFLRHGAERIMLLNNGISTEPSLRLAAQTILYRHGIRVVTADLPRLGRACDGLWADPDGGHADERETSLMLAIAPALVRLDRLAETALEDDAGPSLLHLRQPIRLTPEERPGGSLNRSGATGNATAATAEKGEKLLDAMVAEIAADLRQLWPDL